MDNQTLSVSEFNALVNQTLEFAYPFVTIEGEIAEARPTKHFYFSLKDDQAVLRCIKWGKLRDPVEDGMKVRVTGRPQLHLQYGFSFIVESIEPAGEGSLKRAFELLRAKLDAEGLFAAERKRTIPDIPARIAIVSSSEAAGYKDFIKIINERWRGVQTMLANVQVQGVAAPEQIVAAIEYLNSQPELADVLVIIRGGGSLEDLQAFNTEAVARAISASRIPTVVGVGHEVDTTLADLVADVRAATPTDAARLVVPDYQEVISQVASFANEIEHRLSRNIDAHNTRIQQSVHTLEQFIHLPMRRLDSSVNKLLLLQRQQIEKSKWEVVSRQRMLKSVDPKVLLRRGYAIPRSNGKLVRSSSDVARGDELMLQLAKGTITSEVTDVETG